eukprot:TRINITY_DN22178_c0_g1_i1.p1 TRINITY_DN22178_c0_g1~~TRINITY_DN22178_c0_g1_i1.p1  ORF type:complete len:117 (+),score=17.81 TRINITY_DN22178_c0_g1_i1:50-352(+)
MYSIGIQTIGTDTFDKSTQTVKNENDANNMNPDHKTNNTVSDLVGVYKDIDDLFNVLTNHTDNAALKHLESLRAKVKKLTHMKITERKMGSTESDKQYQN